MLSFIIWICFYLCLHIHCTRGNIVAERMVRKLKLDMSFFTACWFFISCLCEDRGDCCTVTSQNSWSGTCTFCSIWEPMEHFESSLLLVQTAFFRNQCVANQPLTSIWFHCLHDGTHSIIHWSLQTFPCPHSALMSFIWGPYISH